MKKDNPVEVAIRFIEKINRRDFEALGALMSPDHRAMDANGEVNQGRETATNIIADYTRKFPDFQIYINEVYQKGEMVIIVGRTTGSCAETSREVEIKNRLLYTIRVEDGLATEFQYAMDDTEEKRNELGIAEATGITR